MNGILDKKKWVTLGGLLQPHKPLFLLQTSHIQEQSNLITGKETAGGEAVKKCLKLQILATEAVFPGLSLKRSGESPPPNRQLPELTWQTVMFYDVLFLNVLFRSSSDQAALI